MPKTAQSLSDETAYVNELPLWRVPWSEAPVTTAAIFDKVGAPLNSAAIKVREDRGKPIRYITARVVMDRLDNVCPGLWEFRCEPVQTPTEKTGQYVVKGSLTICGITREDFGMNTNQEHFDPAKAAVSDALKRCAVHFGLARELYGDEVPDTEIEQHWTEKPAWVAKAYEVAKDTYHLTREEAHIAAGVNKGGLKSFRESPEALKLCFAAYATAKATFGGDQSVGVSYTDLVPDLSGDSVVDDHYGDNGDSES